MVGRQPDAVIACVGGGSNAMGIFYDYIAHENVSLIGVEAAGEGLTTMRHAASLQCGTPGVLHGNRTYLLQDEDGQITETHSVSAGLDYPGVGPEHAWLKDSGRARVRRCDRRRGAQRRSTTAAGSKESFPRSNRVTPSRTRAKLAPTMPKDKVLLVNLSGRGDKDLHIVAEAGGFEFFCRASCREASIAIEKSKPDVAHSARFAGPACWRIARD